VAIDPVRDVALWRWDLSGDAFGASPPQEDPDGDGAVFRVDLRFPGQRFDAASGLYHNYFRDYDPTVGRYVQSDPIGLLGGMSTYGYANHSPATFSDPMGLFGKKIGGGIANMLVRPIVQRLGGGVAARAASAAAHARAQARRAAEMAQRMQTVLGRILKGRSRKGGEPAGCADVTEGLEIAPGKFDYIFGRVTSNAHNAARSNQMAHAMKQLGIHDTASGRKLMSEHMASSARAQGNVIRTFSNQYGVFEVRDSFLIGPSGRSAQIEATFQVLEDGTRRLSTFIPFL
jgi:RHS repeat-associated protein